MNHAACVAALRLEAAARRDAGEVIPPEVLQLVLEEIEAAEDAAQASRDWFEQIWQTLPKQLGRHAAFFAERSYI